MQAIAQTQQIETNSSGLEFIVGKDLKYLLKNAHILSKNQMVEKIFDLYEIVRHYSVN